MTDKDFRTNGAEKCPKCGSAGWRPLGVPGYGGRPVTMLMLGVIGNAIASSSLANRADNDPFVLKCESCGEKWKASPVDAPEEERLASPCTITLARHTGIVGAAVGQYVYLNGIRIGKIKTGKPLSFQTCVKHNVLCATDLSGRSFKGFQRFEAASGGHESFSYGLTSMQKINQ